MVRSIGRGMAVVMAVGGMWVLFAVPAGASGGGGCGRPTTERTGTSVGITEYCFNPTVIRVPVGARVTFTNHDPWVHTVLGANGEWGSYEELGFEHSVSYVFKHAGVFPFVCTIHTGMTGAVEVGGVKPAASVIRQPAVPLPTTPARLIVPARVAPAANDAGWQIAAVAEAMLLIAGGAVATELARTRRRNLAA